MSDIIHLLPDSVANQIAAGEVIQRPSSAIKEMMENALDAGATEIKVLIKDAGKSLIQIIDNGKGMSETDARMSFERHATSKISKAEDLFKIRTMGFRGEALASIAAIAQVELKTQRREDKLGTSIRIEGSKVIEQIPCSIPAGTSIAVKQLFYNTPARRNFLKSNAVEMRHIIDEFHRVALAHPEVKLSLFSEDKPIHQLNASPIKQRVINLFGKNYNERLVPVEEKTDIVEINGFVGKPEFARKTRTEQFLFVNERYIRDPYLNHAVRGAYENMLPDNNHPLFLLFLDIDPARIDVNVHPTKNEIKFEDEKPIYQILRSAVQRSLGKFNISPSLDFKSNSTYSDSKVWSSASGPVQAPKIHIDPNYNPFAPNSGVQREIPLNQKKSSNDWRKAYEVARDSIFDQEKTTEKEQQAFFQNEEEDTSNKSFQIHSRYIISPIKSGLIIINQQFAHERILFENFLETLESQSGSSQQCLFPQTLDLNAADIMTFQSIESDLRAIGFDINSFGKNSLVINGIPSEMKDAEAKDAVELILENFKNSAQIPATEKRKSIAITLARKSAIKNGVPLGEEERSMLIGQLFACKNSNVALNGKPIFISISHEDLLKKFNS